MQVPSFGETFNVQSRPNATPAQSVGSSFWSKSRHQIKTQCDTSAKCRFQVCGWGLDLGGPVSRFRGFIEYRTLRRSEQVFCAESPPDAPECAFWCQSFFPRLFFKASGTYSDRALDLGKSFAICSGWLYSHFGMAVPCSCGGCPHFGTAVLLFWAVPCSSLTVTSLVQDLGVHLRKSAMHPPSMFAKPCLANLKTKLTATSRRYWISIGVHAIHVIAKHNSDD